MIDMEIELEVIDLIPVVLQHNMISMEIRLVHIVLIIPEQMHMINMVIKRDLIKPTLAV